MRKKHVFAVAAAAVLLLGGATYVAVADQGPTLSGGGFGAGVTVARAGQAYTIAAEPLCLDRGGSVTVEQAVPTGTEGGIRIEAFAVRPMRSNAVGAQTGSLTALGFRPGGPQEVDADDNRVPDELALQLVRTGPESGVVHGVTLSYRSAGRLRHLRLALELALCSKDDHPVAECDG